MIATGKQTISEIIFLVEDVVPRPASIILTPVVSKIAAGKFIGSCCVVFYWDTLLSSGLPTALGGIDVVLQIPNSQPQTFRLTTQADTNTTSNVVSLGVGNLHGETNVLGGNGISRSSLKTPLSPPFLTLS